MEQNMNLGEHAMVVLAPPRRAEQRAVGEARGAASPRHRRSAPARRERDAGPTRLPAAAARLLAALAAPNTSAAQDAFDAARVVLRRGTDGRGVTLSGGAHPIAAAQALVAADLARWQRSAGTRGRRLEITEAGRAYLRRGLEPGAPFASQHRDVVEARMEDPAGAGRRSVALNAAESPLAWLASRRTRDGRPFLPPSSVEAGERFRRDLTLSGIMPGVSIDWSRFGGGGSASGGPAPGGQNATEALVSARQRVGRACDALGSEDADLLIDLCGFLKGLETIERERGWPARSAKMLAARALARLAAHYGLACEARGRATSRAIRVWRSEGSTDGEVADA